MERISSTGSATSSDRRAAPNVSPVQARNQGSQGQCDAYGLRVCTPGWSRHSSMTGTVGTVPTKG
jgi:hypothetical protein